MSVPGKRLFTFDWSLPGMVRPMDPWTSLPPHVDAEALPPCQEVMNWRNSPEQVEQIVNGTTGQWRWLHGHEKFPLVEVFSGPVRKWPPAAAPPSPA
jgi:hypothetical protein